MAKTKGEMRKQEEMVGAGVESPGATADTAGS